MNLYVVSVPEKDDSVAVIAENRGRAITLARRDDAEWRQWDRGDFRAKAMPVAVDARREAVYEFSLAPPWVQDAWCVAWLGGEFADCDCPRCEAKREGEGDE